MAKAVTPLERILKRCKFGVSVEVNTHRNVFMTVEAHLKEQESYRHKGDPLYIAPDIRAKMIETDTLIYARAYPNNQVGFYEVYHYYLDAALSELADHVEKEPIG